MSGRFLTLSIILEHGISGSIMRASGLVKAKVMRGQLPVDGG
ncbi:MAG: hypothetical protein WBO36_17025 [Saprospiraceae bacterium]